LQQCAGPLRELVYRLAGEKYKTLVEIALLWEDLVGSLLAERSFISKIEQKTLFVSVSNSTWLQEFTLLKQPLLDSLHKKGFNEIHDIVFMTKNVSRKPNYSGKKHA